MRALRLLVALVAFANELAAGQVSFQSGEHEGYTRLVMTLPATSTDWSFSGEGKRYEISIVDEDLSIKDDNIFDRIGQERLAEVSSDVPAGKITLRLNCDCIIRHRDFAQSYVIFDIHDDARDAPKDAAKSLSFGLDLIVASSDRVLQFPTYASQGHAVTDSALVPSNDAAETEITELDQIERALVVSDAQSELLQEISRAASQGLLQPDTSRKASALAESSDSDRAPLDPDHIFSAGLPSKKSDNFVAFNIMDEARSDVSSGSKVGLTPVNCIPDAQLAIGSWGQPENMQAQISALRAQIYGEFDQLIVEKAEDLARVYLYFTFGAEARRVLELIPNRENEVLVEISRLLDGDASESEMFQNRAHCNGHQAIWAALAGVDLDGKEVVDAALNAFNNLPRHLREHMAPELSKHLARMGQSEAADLVLNAIERLGDSAGSELKFAEASLAKAKGATEVAGNAFLEISNSSGELSPLAAIELIDLHLTEDLPPSEDLLSLIGAYAVEYKGTDIGKRMSRARFLGFLQADQFDQAIAALNDIRVNSDEEQLVDLHDAFAERLLSKATDYSIVDQLMRHDLARARVFSPDTSLAIADKLENLGFVGPAKQMMQATTGIVSAEKRQLILAKIAMADGLPKRAEAELLGAKSEEADRLRAKAKSMSGDHSGSSAILRRLGDNSGSEEEAWLASDWLHIAQSRQPMYRVAAELANQTNHGPEEGDPESLTDGILEANRQLVSESEETRKQLSALLEHYRLTGSESR